MFAFLSGCAAQITGIEKVRNYENTLQCTSETALTIDNINGTVSIQTDSDTRDAVVSAVLSVTAGSEDAAEKFLDMIEIHFVREGDVFVIESKVPKVWTMKGRARKPRSWKVDYQITIPEGFDITAGVTNGDVEILGANASVIGQTINGNVAIKDNTGSVNAVSTNGSTEVSNDQDFKLKIKQITQNGSNTLNLPNAKYGDYSLRTTNGKIIINMASSVEPKIIAKAVNGDITLGLGERLSAVIDLKTTNGKVSTNMIVNTTTVGGKKETHHLHGMIGSGLGEVTVETKNGSVVMNRAE